MGIDLAWDHGVATLTFNRPQAYNAFNTPMLQELLQTCQELGEDRAVRCVIITGAGKAFAAGADIKEMASLSQTEIAVFGRLGQSVAAAIEAMPQPVIAAVNGFAFGGGCELALACDIRLAADNAQFGQQEVKLGIPPGWGGTQRLPRLVGPGMAAELIFTGRRVNADEARRIGLVNAVYASGQLMEATLKLARQIAGNSPRAISSAKKVLALALSGDVAAGFAAEAAVFAESFGTEDQIEGMRAFVEKREPAFTGA